jgi:hypothetical protein
MLKIRWFVTFLGSLILLAACSSPAAPQPTLAPAATAAPTVPDAPKTATTATSAGPGLKLILPTYPDNTHLFYIELLQKSLEAAGVTYTIEYQKDLPQTRAVQMLDDGQLSLMWMLANADRDAKYTRVDVGLTNGLIGQRILLIPPEKEEIYASVQTLDDFRRLEKVGAFGKNWFDAQVWAANGLKYEEIDGEWRVIYNMVAEGNRGLDYFSRGFTEVVGDAAEHPNLKIESHLVLIYNRDFYYYLSSSAAPYKEVLQKALLQAQTSGLINELVQKYWANSFAKLNMDKRIKIELETPK